MPLKVLLADDSMTAQNMGKKILSEAGYQVIAVSNGAQAMKKLASEKPDLVLLDVYMPGYTGLEICERIKSTPESANTPVVLCVAKMEPFKPEDGIRVKADAVIIKPFEATDLVARMQEMQDKLARWRASQAEVETTISRFEPEETVEVEVARSRVEVPEEMAATPAFGIELEPESAPDLSKFTGEFVIEHEREPVDVSGSTHMVAADGLSGVFEMQQPAAKRADVEEFEIAAPVGEPEPQVETRDSAESGVAPDPAVERFGSAEVPAPAEVAHTSQFEVVAAPEVVISEAPSKPDSDFGADAHAPSSSQEAELTVEAQADAAAEVEPRPEFVVDRVMVPVSEALTEAVAEPLPPDPVSPAEITEPAPVERPECPMPYAPQPAGELQPESFGAVAVAPAEETTTDFEPSLNWVADEVALDPGEATGSLEDEMKALISETSERQGRTETSPEFEVGQVEEASEESVRAEGELAHAPEPPPETIEQAVAAPDIFPAGAQVVPEESWPSADSLRCDAERVIEAKPTGEAEAGAPEQPGVESNQLASTMAAMIAGSIGPADASAAADPNRVEQAVDKLLDRLKPDLVSQILRELNKK